MKRILLSILLCVLFASPVWAATYWVSPTGTKTVYSDCVGATPPADLANHCNYTTGLSSVNGQVVGGDTVYFRNGDYSYSTNSGTLLSISASGSAGNFITYAKYSTETPNFVGTYGTRMSGIVLSGASYIIIDGLTVTDFSDSFIIKNSSHHIEVKNNTLTTATSPYRGVAGFHILDDCGGGASYLCSPYDIWVHDNNFDKLVGGGGAGWPSGTCSSTISEGGDAVRIGYSSNTCGTEKGTSTTSNALELGSKTFSTQAGMALSVGDRIKLTADSTHYMNGEITDYTDTSLTVDIKWIIGTGTFESWSIRDCAGGKIKNLTFEDNYMAHGGHVVMDSFSIQSVFRRNVAHNEPWYPADNGECSVYFPATDYTNESYNGFYSHRVWHFTDTFQRTASYNLIESNRLGHAGVNPNNDGSTSLTMASPGNIVRYNAAYDTMNTLMKTKYGTGYGWQGSGAQNCKYYNNTLYTGGYGNTYFQTCTITDNPTCPKLLIGFRFYAANQQPNFVFKNNIVYGSYGAVVKGYEDIQDDASANISLTNNLCTNTDAVKCIVVGDPLFTDPDVSVPASLTLPDLTIQSGSPAIDRGTHLTVTVGTGTNSTTLIVDDALYFQAGSAAATTPMGSSLSSVQGDWIQVGAVLTQITDINYDGRASANACNEVANCMIISPAISWADDAQIRLYKLSDGTTQVLYGTTNDLGAHESNYTSNYEVTSSVVGSVGGTISPLGVQSIVSGETATFTITAKHGWKYGSETGDCGGSITDTQVVDGYTVYTFVTSAITGACGVTPQMQQIQLMNWVQ